MHNKYEKIQFVAINYPCLSNGNVVSTTSANTGTLVEVPKLRFKPRLPSVGFDWEPPTLSSRLRVKFGLAVPEIYEIFSYK